MGKEHGESFRGFTATILAFAVWGVLPVYWKLIRDVSPLEILAHRIIWSLVLLVFLLSIQRKWADVAKAASTPSVLRTLIITGSIIAANWLLYIWTVNTNRVVEASLGYYINPLVNILFGFIFFKDKLRKLQWAAIALAASGVLYQLLKLGELPWASLGLAFTFGTYGLLRKIVNVDSSVGLFIETLLLSVPAMLVLGYMEMHGMMFFCHTGMGTDLLLIGTGVVTSIPMVTFVYGAKRLSLVTVGILQYLSPTISFFLGIFVYGEPFSPVQLTTFACIWGALAIYTVESILFLRSTSERA